MTPTRNIKKAHDPFSKGASFGFEKQKLASQFSPKFQHISTIISGEETLPSSSLPPPESQSVDSSKLLNFPTSLWFSD